MLLLLVRRWSSLVEVASAASESRVLRFVPVERVVAGERDEEDADALDDGWRVLRRRVAAVSVMLEEDGREECRWPGSRECVRSEDETDLHRGAHGLSLGRGGMLTCAC